MTEENGGSRELDRLIFSDAVFAIVMTLLVLPVVDFAVWRLYRRHRMRAR